MKGFMHNLNENIVHTLVETLQNTRDKILVQLLYETSRKIQEVCDIKVKDVKENFVSFDNKINISKKLSKSILGYIKKNSLEKSDYLFSSRQSERITTKRARQIIQKISNEILGYSINPEDIRKISIKEKLSCDSVNKVKKEAGLKRLDKRKYLSEEEIKKLEARVEDKRDKLFFELLLSGFKSKQIIDFKLEDSFLLDSSLQELIEDFAIENKKTFGENLFLTNRNNKFSKERIFQIIKDLGKRAGIDVSPQILNNNAICKAINSKNPKQELKKLGIKNSAFHLHGGFYNE